MLRLPLLQTPYGLLGQWLQRFDLIRSDIDQLMKQQLTMQSLSLEGKKQELKALKPSARLEHYRQKLLFWEREIKGGFQRKLHRAQEKLTLLQEQLNRAWRHSYSRHSALFQAEDKIKTLDTVLRKYLSQKRERLEKVQTALDILNPKNILSKGYCILFSEKEHSAITSVDEVRLDQRVQVLLSDGKLLTTINEIIPG
jgi:exodeoxyribonuclease VII large subunit